jgi:hypothetical protein
MGRTTAIGMAMAVMVAVAMPATAGARQARGGGAPLPAARVMQVGLGGLEATDLGGSLQVRFAVDRRTWKQARALGARLDVHVRFDDGTARVEPLARRAGVLSFDVPRNAGARRATIWIEGQGDRGVRYAGMVLEGRRLDVISVVLRDRDPRHDPRRGPPDRVATAPRVVEACDRALIGNEATLACVREAGAFRTDPVPAIGACADAMIGNDATLRCIGAAARLRPDAPAVVRACERASIGNEATLRCIEASAAGGYAMER